MAIAAHTGIAPESLLGLDWDDLITLADVVAEMGGGKRAKR